MQNYMGNVANAFQAGRQMRSEMETQKALGALLGNPQDPQAMQRLGQANPQMAMQFQQQQQQAAMAQIEANRDKILMGAQVFRAAKAKNPNIDDVQLYVQLLPTFQRMGINTQGLPQPGDPQLPQYLQSIMAIADGLAPEKGQQSRFVPVQPGGSVLEVGPDGKQRWVVAPEGTVPQELTDEDIMQLEGGQTGSGSSGNFR
jgi:hypothetical protein